MPFIFRILRAQSSVATSATVPLYTVGSSPTTSAIISSVRIYNNDPTNPTTVLIQVKPLGGSSAVTIAALTSSALSSNLYANEITLAATGILQVATSAQSVDCVITGVERVN